MPDATSFNNLTSNTRLDVNASPGEILVSAHGDFARGQRHGAAGGRARGDFATGMRTISMLRMAADFATGMRTSPRTINVGDFATGMRRSSAPVVVDAFTSAVDALPLAA